jgi:hypothetical protein
MTTGTITPHLALILALALATSPASAADIPEKATAEAQGLTASPRDEKYLLSSQLAAFYALDSWKNAWRAADVPRYLAAYSRRFRPSDNVNLAAWKQKRAESLTRPKFIRLDIKDPVVEMLSDTQLLITFTQSFESDTYQDAVIKTLTMEKEEDGWKILEERTVQELPR